MWFGIGSLRVAILALSCVFGLTQFSVAQTTTPPPAAVPTPATIQEAATFKADPAAWLAQASAKQPGLPVANEIRSIVYADPTTSQQVIDLARAAGASSKDKASLLYGLAQAAQDFITAQDTTNARNIQQQIAQTGDTSLVALFTSDTNEIQTGAIAGATATGGGVGSGTSGPADANKGTPPTNPDTPTPNIVSAFAIPTSNPVSPSR